MNLRQIAGKIHLASTRQRNRAGPSAHLLSDHVNPGALRTSVRTAILAGPGRHGAFRLGGRATNISEGSGGDEPQRPGATGPGIHCRWAR